ncbi:MAG: hypothetical protein M1817_004371 [Caeruleum heppii]|nr:MAG: hypothetical protein M1817_004371 [Caeruleum heppii]
MVTSLLSVDSFAARGTSFWRSVASHCTWFSVKGDDYLLRDKPGAALMEKLRTYLVSQGVDGDGYPFAYLITAPRFLGYQFNPVSFWYLYDSNKELQAMILEVNNTTDERRMYLLRKSTSQTNSAGLQEEHRDDRLDEVEEANGSGAPKSVRFSMTWPKDFHVSPFNDRQGTYSLVARDPLEAYSAGEGLVNNRLTLRATQGPVVLVASLVPTGPWIDPFKLSIAASAKLVLAWGWVGLVTFPRILREAVKLFKKRGLGINVYFRPEVKIGTVPRQETIIESRLEPYFRRFLQHQVAYSGLPCTIKYVPSITAQKSIEISGLPPSSVSKDPVNHHHIEFKVLSPAFYSRFAHYAHTMEAFSQEMLSTRDENKTVWVSDPKVLPKLFATATGRNPRQRGFLNRWRWELVRYLRVLPAEQSYPSEEKPVDHTSRIDIRHLPLSSLDNFVAEDCSPTEASAYRSALLRLFLAERLAWGFTPLLQLYDIIIRGFLMYLAHRLLFSSLAKTLDRMKASKDGNALFMAAFAAVFVWHVGLKNAHHLWAVLKALV